MKGQLTATLGAQIELKNKMRGIRFPETDGFDVKSVFAEISNLMTLMYRSWHRTIREVTKRAHEKAEESALELRSVVLTLPSTAPGNLRMTYQSRFETQVRIADELKSRVDWAYRSEIEDDLSDAQRMFIGQTKGVDGWDGGFWQWDVETMAEGEERPKRTFVTLQLIARIGSRVTQQAMALVEGQDPESDVKMTIPWKDAYQRLCQMRDELAGKVSS